MLILGFWILVIFSFVAGAVHGRAVEQIKVIDTMTAYHGSEQLLVTRLERVYDILWDEEARLYR